jgi:hypothetical protein
MHICPEIGNEYSNSPNDYFAAFSAGIMAGLLYLLTPLKFCMKLLREHSTGMTKGLLHFSSYS